MSNTSRPLFGLILCLLSFGFISNQSYAAGTCAAHDVLSLQTCVSQLNQYDSIQIKANIVCRNSECCQLFNIMNQQNKLISGNGWTIHRTHNQRICSALSLRNSSNITVQSLKFDEDDSVGPCTPYEGCAHAISVTNSAAITFKKVEVYHAKSFAIAVSGTNGFRLDESVVANSGVIGTYVGNRSGVPSQNVQIVNSVFSRNRTNAVVFQGVTGSALGANQITGNVLNSNHYNGLYLDSFGVPHNGG